MRIQDHLHKYYTKHKKYSSTNVKSRESRGGNPPKSAEMMIRFRRHVLLIEADKGASTLIPDAETEPYIWKIMSLLASLGGLPNLVSRPMLIDHSVPTQNFASHMTSE